MPRLAAAVVIHNDHVLIISRSHSEGFLPGQWGVPCGKIDEDEPAQQAVLRELYEETGLRGSVVGWVGKLHFRSTWRGQLVTNAQDNYLVNIYLTRTDSAGMPEITLPKQDQEAKWVATSRIGSVGLDHHNLQVIRQGLAQHSASVA